MFSQSTPSLYHPSGSPAPALNPGLRWRPPGTVSVPAAVADWLADNGSLTRRLQTHGAFRVARQYQAITEPRPEERDLLSLAPRRHALIREVLLYLDDTPVVFARSVLPLSSLTGANRVLGHMANRSLGAELFRAPAAQRQAVWYAHYPATLLPASLSPGTAWGRQSRFLKRGRALLVSEVFLPSLWQRLGIDVN